jgi:SAM-dependent methyltransferase
MDVSALAALHTSGGATGEGIGREASTLFGVEYAASYDDLYRDKDYVGECDLIERIFSRYGREVKSVLDLGCGTGGHAVPLATRGYAVLGVDRSAEMLGRAAARESPARFTVGDLLRVDLGETFDAALLMFAVLGYQVSNADVRTTLESARRHLTSGGLLFGDVWYGPAVLAQRPSERVKVIEAGDGQIIRVASGELDTLSDVCTVTYRVWRIDDGRVQADVREEHRMRYFFAPELELFLSDAGFELLRLGAFPEFDDEPTETTWNVAFIARAV